ERHPSFAYIDRVAIDERQRGAGWGPALYREFEAWARESGRSLLCAEVNTEPPNPRSLRFHDLFGFDMVAQFRPYGTNDYRVGMMEKRLR
ncbi:MAG: GNAT family N-acetyltransferase, partial [Acidimicrobiia bacterium]|nr:GNAT family N-acetyltransferase [Acidimicrobiia bacterium]